MEATITTEETITMVIILKAMAASTAIVIIQLNEIITMKDLAIMQTTTIIAMVSISQHLIITAVVVITMVTLTSKTNLTPPIMKISLKKKINLMVNIETKDSKIALFLIRLNKRKKKIISI